MIRVCRPDDCVHRLGKGWHDADVQAFDGVDEVAICVSRLDLSRCSRAFCDLHFI